MERLLKLCCSSSTGDELSDSRSAQCVVVFTRVLFFVEEMSFLDGGSEDLDVLSSVSADRYLGRLFQDLNSRLSIKLSVCTQKKEMKGWRGVT